MIETKRLRVIPLTPEQFALFLNGINFMEDVLKLTPSGETLDANTQEAMTCQYQLATKYPESFPLLTSWQIILKSENKAIGSACFKNLPDKASQRVLQKNGMKQYKESTNSIWWKLNKEKMENNKAMIIRQETKEEYQKIYNLVQTAFQTAKVADGDEQDFTVRLWNSENYIPELGLVAEQNGKLIGHILLTRMYVIQEDGSKFESLLIAPLSVLLEYRDQGVGSALIKEGLKRGREMGYKAAFLCGDPNYYHRFGFKSISEFGLTNPDIPEPYVMGYELEAGALDHVTGIAKLV